MCKYIEAYINELLGIDEQIKCRIIKNQDRTFEAILVNRNNIGNESVFKFFIPSNEGRGNGFVHPQSTSNTLRCSIGNESKDFILSLDEFHMYWSEQQYFQNRQITEFNPKEIADIIWQNWLESVGIV